MLMPESAALCSIAPSAGVFGHAEGVNACAADAAHKANPLANRTAKAFFITVSADSSGQPWRGGK
jgi:hypothetical protein